LEYLKFLGFFKNITDNHNRAFIIALLALVIVVAGLTTRSILLKKNPDPETGVTYTHYNNFLIFRGSFYHLIENSDLYKAYPEEYYDLYKYSPTFALLMAPIAVFPARTGLFLWNLLNVLILFTALWKFPSFNQKQKLLALAFILIEMITSIQNTQSNALMAGLIILGFIMLEKNKPWIASLLIVLTVFIKIFGLVALAIFIFYPKKLKNALIILMWFFILALLPLLVLSPSILIQQYSGWMGLLSTDAAVYTGLSVMTWLYTWFWISISKNIIIAVGAFLLLIPLVRLASWKSIRFRIYFLSSLLIWMIIFNHMAESPTFVIAVSGVVIWFFSKEKMRWEDIALVSLVLLFTVLSPTDIFPSSLRRNLVEPYVLKAVPCIFVWFKIQFDLFAMKNKQLMDLS
jgi:hypothetical protein